MTNPRLNSRMDLADNRRSRVRQLIQSRFQGVAAQFAAAIGRSPTQVARWFMAKPHKRDIGEKIARDIEKRLALPRGWLDSEDNNHSAQQPLGIYAIDLQKQQQLLDLFDHLSEEQQEELLAELIAKKLSNEAIFKRLSGRIKHVTRARAAETLPPAPKPKAKA
jgi:hypothetical protein